MIYILVGLGTFLMHAARLTAIAVLHLSTHRAQRTQGSEALLRRNLAVAEYHDNLSAKAIGL
ncbi:hypothetical protein Pan258_02130 [Symmachiella dynata]|nr:hypothetical protein Pan258_02130 [Symmachiella dynata]